MLEATITKIRRQLIKIKFTQSPNVVITTIGVETMVAPNTNIIKSGILIGSVTNLGNGSGGVSIGRNLSRSSTLLRLITKVVGTP